MQGAERPLSVIKCKAGTAIYKVGTANKRRLSNVAKGMATFCNKVYQECLNRTLSPADMLTRPMPLGGSLQPRRADRHRYWRATDTAWLHL